MSQVSAHRVRKLTAPVDLLSCFEALRKHPYPWLLDSGAAPGAPSAEMARYSFMGADPYLVLRARGRRCELTRMREAVPGTRVGESAVDADPLEIAQSLLPGFDYSLREFDNAPPFLGGAVGYFGYELGQVCEPVTFASRDDFDLPDLVLMFVDRLLVIDHLEGCAYAVGLGFEGEAAGGDAQERADLAADWIEEVVEACSRRLDEASWAAEEDLWRRRQLLEAALPCTATTGFSAAGYAEAVERIRGEIACGNVYQANMTQRLDLSRCDAARESDADHCWRIYRALRSLSPAPFASYIELPEVAIASSSPERFLKLDRDRRVVSRPIKGTRRRGSSDEEDTLLEKELASSAKDRAENLMIVDLVRNDLGRVCETGSVEVPELMAIEPYATVFQMVSTVCGTLREECGAMDLLRASFPPGSMTGTPKIAAMQLIDRIEPVRRGIYSGAIGYLDAGGALDLSVVIRTLLVRDGQIHIHSGGAVVHDSVPEDEYRESIDKIRALLAAVSVCQ